MMKIPYGLLLLALLAPAAAAEAPSAAPVDFETATISGQRFDLLAHRDEWVVVNFWATWCKPCRKEIPDLDALHLRRDDVTVLGLAFEEATPEDLLAFLVDYPASYPIALVDVYGPPEAFPVPRVLPTTLLLSPGGQLARTVVGPVTAAELEAFMVEASAR